MIRIGERDRDIVIYHLADKFRPDTEDEFWISELATDGDWIIISSDPRISRDKGPREAWRQSGLTAFFLFEKFSSKKFWNQVEFMASWWPDIKQRARECKRGTGYRVSGKPAQLQIIYEPE